MSSPVVYDVVPAWLFKEGLAAGLSEPSRPHAVVPTAASGPARSGDLGRLGSMQLLNRVPVSLQVP
jgi:hypothetical protein